MYNNISGGAVCARERTEPLEWSICDFNAKKTMTKKKYLVPTLPRELSVGERQRSGTGEYILRVVYRTADDSSTQ